MAGDDDKLDWIFSSADSAALEARYDQWAATYDDDHDDWGWRGPELAVAALLEHDLPTQVVLDAGCGTGRAGTALRSAGFGGRLIGLDLSAGMLHQASSTGAYDALVKGSVLDMAIEDSSVGAVVSTGVFTHGHVGGEGFAELCRVAQPSGVVVITQRVDLTEQFAPFEAALTEEGTWQPLPRDEAANFHPDHGDTRQIVATWRVN